MPRAKEVFTSSLLICVGCNWLGVTDTHLDYLVNLRGDAQVDIEISLKSDGKATLLESLGNSRHLALSNVLAFSDEGIALQADHWQEEGHSRISLPAGSSKLVKVKYTVSPGAMLFNGQTAIGRSGHVGEDILAVSGASLFLYPTGRDLEASIRVSGNRTDSVFIEGAEQRCTGCGRLWVDGDAQLASLHILAGVFTEFSRGTVTVRVPSAWGAKAPRLVDDFLSLADRLAAILGDRGEDHHYTLIPMEGGLPIWTTPNSTSTVLSIDPEVPDWYQIGVRMADGWTWHSRARIPVVKIEDAWLPNGLSVRTALSALSQAPRIGPFGKAEYVRDLFAIYHENYGRWIMNRGKPVLREIFSGGGVSESTLRAVSAVAILLIEDRLGQGGEPDFEELISRLQANRRLNSVESELADYEPLAAFIDSLYSPVWWPVSMPQRYGVFAGPGDVAKAPVQGEVTSTLDTLTLVITGHGDGFLESCGCVSTRSGGLDRRHQVFQAVRDLRRNVLVLDTGDFLPDPNKTAELDSIEFMNFQTYVRALKMSDYDAIGMGVHDRYFESSDTRVKTELRASGLPLLHQGNRLRVAVGPSRLDVLIEGKSVPRIAGIEGRARSVMLLDRAIAQHEARNERPKADLHLAVGSIEAKDIAFELSAGRASDIYVTQGNPVTSTQLIADGPVPLSYQESGFMGNALVIGGRTEVYGVKVVDVHLGESQEVVGFEEAEIDANRWLAGSEEIRLVIDEFYEWVGRFSGGHAPATLRRIDAPEATGFVGSDACRTCHGREWSQWGATPHSTALKTLIKTRRAAVPKCVSCHVVGFGYDTGYIIGDGESEMAGVGCEMCHGPAREHVEVGGQVALTRTPPEARCLSCHDPEHDPGFSYLLDFERVRH